MRLVSRAMFSAVAALILTTGVQGQSLTIHAYAGEMLYFGSVENLSADCDNSFADPAEFTLRRSPDNDIHLEYDGQKLRLQSFVIDSGDSYGDVFVVPPSNQYSWIVKAEEPVKTFTTILSVPTKQVFPVQTDSLTANDSSFQPSQDVGTKASFVLSRSVLQVRAADTITHLPISPILASPILEELLASNHLSNCPRTGIGPVTCAWWIYSPRQV